MGSKSEIAEMMEKESVVGQLPVYRLYADGASTAQRKKRKRRGIGSWAFRLEEEGGRVVEASGYEPFLSNNRAELLAVVKGLECINPPAQVIVYTDYQSFLDVLAQLETWKARDWRKSRHSCNMLADADLWMKVYELSRVMQISAQKVSRSQPEPKHRRCHQLASHALRIGRRKGKLLQEKNQNPKEPTSPPWVQNAPPDSTSLCLSSIGNNGA